MKLLNNKADISWLFKYSPYRISIFIVPPLAALQLQVFWDTLQSALHIWILTDWTDMSTSMSF